MNKKKKIHEPIALPCLRGHMGDWFYYVTLLKYSEVATRVLLPKEIDAYYANKENLKLGDWIQRDLQENRTKNIIEYLRKQPQHFFNSLILGIYEGKPTWQDLNLSVDKIYDTIDEHKLDYLSRTFGLLNLDGSEDIFAIDGQHRAIAIREAVKLYPKLNNDEVAVIFVGHNPGVEGKIRTRRLFSTLNKYAKPVSQSEIIAFSEDNNCAIITRELVDNFPLLKDKILIIKNRSISPENTTHFSNILVLYDIVECLLTNRSIVGIKVKGKDKNIFITTRASDDEIKKSTLVIKNLFQEIVKGIPSLNSFFDSRNINRKSKKSSLLFRPIGQNIFFNVLKVGIDNSKKTDVIQYFAKDKFNLKHPVWKKVFWDEETGTIISEKSRQRFATLLILEKLGINVNRTKKDEEILAAFNITFKDI